MRHLTWVWIATAACGFDHGGLSPRDANPRDALDGASDTIDAPRATSPRRIVFDNSGNAQALTNFTVLVPLTPSTIDYSAVANPATNLRFTDASGTVDLPFEVDFWNPAGESLVWVRVPAIAANSTTDSILMNFGDSALGAENAALTWLGYNVANHLRTGFANSVGSAYSGQTAGTVATAAGKLGEAALFTGGTDGRITLQNSGGLFASVTDFALTFWLYADYDDINVITGEPHVIDKGGPLSLGRFFVVGTGTTAELVFQIDLHFTGSNNDVYLNTRVTPKTWTEITYTFDGSTVRLYKDGAPAGNDPLSGTSQTTTTGTNNVVLGDATNPINGMIDELQIEPTNRTAAWVAAQHKSMTRAFVTVTDP